MKKYYLLVFLLFVQFLTQIQYTSSQEIIKGENLFNMSLEELMNVTVKTGNITGLSFSKTPVSVTTISSSDIAVTPAKNIYDLLEVYVPGAIFYNHYDSPHLGVRGIIVDRNYKYLLLVNGRNMNLKAHNGATSELEMWDMGDIEKIEVIRGPGSVTYGPGAVAGIINITTKNSFNKQGIHISTNYNYIYNSMGISIGSNQKVGNNNLYIYGSIQKTDGYKDPTVYAPQSYNKFGYIGYDTLSDIVPSDYFADYNNLPQLKFHAEYSFLNDCSLSLRYTRQGATLNPIISKQRPQTGFDSLGNIVFGSPVNLAQNQDQHISLNLKNETTFENLFTLSSLISLSSEYYIRRTEWFRTFPKNFAPSWDSVLMFQDVNSLWNHDYDFSESSILGQFIFNRDFSENFKLAAGTELSLNHWGPGWGNDRRNFRMGDNYDIISGTDSYVYGSKYEYTGVPEGAGYFVGNGWSTFTYSFLFELMWEPERDFSILLSGRSDKDSYSKWLFSPRIALIYEIADNNILKLVLQQSQRMNTSSQLLIQHLSGKETKPETLNGIELMYSGLFNENYIFNASIFYNNLDVISWYNIGRTTRPTGNLSLIGIDFETKFNFDNLEISISQTYVKQLNWNLADSVYFSGISYSDYYLELNNMAFKSSGNDLSNWSNYSTKLILSYKLFEGDLIFHMDSRIFWNFDGEKEGLKSFENGIDPSNPDYLLMQDMLKTFKDINMYGSDFRVNFSICYNLNENLKLTALVMNVFEYEGNKRYYYDSGIKKTTNMFRSGFIEEPFTLALKLDIKY